MVAALVLTGPTQFRSDHAGFKASMWMSLPLESHVSDRERLLHELILSTAVTH
jgi:hypothetical protein